MPKGATAVDFAFAVHTKIGETCVGVRINGKTRQLATELENGDQIEILTEPNAKPKAEWESFVLTGRAKSTIRRFIRAQRASEFTRIGKALIQKTFREHNKSFRSRSLERALGAFGVTKLEELFVLVGEDRLSPRKVLEKLHPDAVTNESVPARPNAARSNSKPKLTIRGDTRELW